MEGDKKSIDTTAQRHGEKNKFIVLLSLCFCGVVFFGVCACYLYLSISYPSISPPSFQQVQKSYRRSDAVLLDRHHEVIHELRVDPKRRRLDWIPFAETSPALKSAIVFAEDRRFYEHHGVDWKALGGILLKSFSFENFRGASTITMQLSSKLNPTLQPRNSRRTLWQKWLQIQSARQIEQRWTKPQILEAYLNLISFRGELQGISAASHGLFDKQPQGLDDSESVILASLVRAPNAPLEQVAVRSCQLSMAMNLTLDCAVITSKTREVLSTPYSMQPAVALAPHVALRLLQANPGSGSSEVTRLQSTLEGQLQRFALETLQRRLMTVRVQNVHDGAVLVVDNKSGEVLAYVGNIGDMSSARYVDGIQGLRQAGSILKPFLYGLAFERRLMTPVSLIDDSPLDLPAINGVYRPENYDNRFHGLVTARTALASSLNIPAVKTLGLVGVEEFVKELSSLEFRNLQSPDFYGPSLALGSADITLWDLVNAYRSLANGGIWSPMRLTPDATSGEKTHRVLSPEAAFLISDILSDRGSRSATFELESPLATRFWTAVKTGTSKDMRDNWCVGFSSQYTVGVWVGNFSGQAMWNVSGITGAAPVWVEIMNWLHHDQPSVAPAPPMGVVQQKVGFANSGQSRREWFIKGTEITQVEVASAATNFRIVYPASGTIVALDPDIPEEQQKLFFECAPKDGQLRWLLDGQEIGSAESVVLWSPKKGRHKLALVDTDHQVLDSVDFEVRGNLKEAASRKL